MGVITASLSNCLHMSHPINLIENFFRNRVLLQQVVYFFRVIQCLFILNERHVVCHYKLRSFRLLLALKRKIDRTVQRDRKRRRILGTLPNVVVQTRHEVRDEGCVTLR